MEKLADIHIGEAIGKRIQDLGMSYSDVARQLHVDRTTIYSIIKSKSIDTERLVNLSNILSYDFFSLYQPFVIPHTVDIYDVKRLLNLLEGGKSLLLTLSLKSTC